VPGTRLPSWSALADAIGLVERALGVPTIDVAIERLSSAYGIRRSSFGAPSSDVRYPFGVARVCTVHPSPSFSASRPNRYR
jgi:hypothetical protein